MHYNVKRRCSTLLHNNVIISIRLLTFASSIRQRVPRDLAILWYEIFYTRNSRQQNSWW